MRFRLNHSGRALYLQLIQQIQHAIETGILRPGDQLPGIRTLAEELVVSPNTIVKAYSELEHEGLLDLRHGAGAFVTAQGQARPRVEKLRIAKDRIRSLIDALREDGLSSDEIHRVFEAELLYSDTAETSSR